MKNEELNLVEILKDVPIGTEFYCTIYGNVRFDGVTEMKDYPISFRCIMENGYNYVQKVTSKGMIYEDFNGECVIFPSRNNRDWSTFKYVPKHEFKPYDKVLVRDEDSDRWRVEFFSHFDEGEEYPYECIGASYHYCIPYEGNEHLVGKTDMPKGGGECKR